MASIIEDKSVKDGYDGHKWKLRNFKMCGGMQQA